MRIVIDRLWDGTAVDERYLIDLSVEESTRDLLVSVDAPYFADPLPETARGSVANLYDYEVVELFLFGARERYLEVELGPGGHYLALTFEGLRQKRETVAIDFDRPVIEALRWRGRGRVPRGALPPAASRVNAHAIHGCSPRSFLSAGSRAGSRPDFHRADAALELEPALARKLALV